MTLASRRARAGSWLAVSALALHSLRGSGLSWRESLQGPSRSRSALPSAPGSGSAWMAASRLSVRCLGRTLRAARSGDVRLLALPVALREIVARREVAVRAHLGRAADEIRLRPEHCGRVVEVQVARPGAVVRRQLVLDPTVHPAVDRGPVERVASVHEVLAVRVVLCLVLEHTRVDELRGFNRKRLVPAELPHVGCL
ncbi:hypothetical protein PybrP1_005052 [[Pythium] brassicae (nom. inval.)]|nr:hypothetical protein PybrP1_005052 [[Pythium] brassicae (nom. inval.)]